MANTEFKRQEDKTPHNYEAERSVISCMLQNNDLIDEAFSIITTDEMFYDPIFRAMFKSIGELKQTGFIADKVTVTDKTIPKASVTETINGMKKKVEEKGFDVSVLDDSFFAEMLRSTPITSNIKTYCNLVKEKYLLRKSIELAQNIILDCQQGNKNAQEICNDAQDGFFAYGKSIGQKDHVRIDSYISEIFDDILSARQIPDGITGVRSGYKKLDEMTAGFQNSDMIVLGGRPGQGKTAFALNLAYNISKFNKQSVLFFSLEMGGKQLARRVISSSSKISTHDLVTGKFPDKDWQSLLDGTKDISGIKLYIDEDSYLTIAEMRNKCMKKKKEDGLDIVFIDYLQLMHAGSGYRNSGNSKNGFMNRQEELAEISRNIKGLAKELNIPIIALSQLKREAESKGEGPQISDLRESGAIEQDADIIMLINRPEKEDDVKTDIIIAKHRNGSTGKIELRFNKATTRFEEYDYHTDVNV